MKEKKKDKEKMRCSGREYGWKRYTDMNYILTFFALWKYFDNRLYNVFIEWAEWIPNLS